MWGRNSNQYSSGWIDIYTDNNVLVTTVSVNLGTWTQFSLNQYSQRIKKIVLRRPNVSDAGLGHIFIDNFQFTPIPDVQSVTIDSVGTSSAVSDIGTDQRIFPDKHSPNENVDRRTVRVTANVGQPGVMVHFKNVDVDDPSSDPLIDENDGNGNGPTGNDNRDGRNAGPGQPYPASAAGVLSQTSAITNSSGVATVLFTVTRQPGDNFRIAASTDNGYLTGVVANGTGLKDAANIPLPEPGAAAPNARARQTKLLTVWRKIHLEVDSMGPVVQNYVSGFVRGKGKYVTSQPTWLEVYPTTGPVGEAGSLPLDAYKETKTVSGTRVSYGGRIVLDGAQALLVLDNREIPRGSGVPPGSEIEVVSLSGDIYVRPNQPFRLYDDDDFNDSEGPPAVNPFFDGDDQEDVDYRLAPNFFSETFSLLQPTPNISLNPYADAYIEPDFNWAANQPGMNDSNVPYETIASPALPFGTTSNFTTALTAINRDRDSSGDERDEFWIGYIIIGYQTDYLQGDYLGRSPILGGIATSPNASAANSVNEVTDSRNVPQGHVGALLWIENIRDWDLIGGEDVRVRSAPHELGHQFGLKGDVNISVLNWELMGYGTTSKMFAPKHVNVMRWRIRSPGE